MVRKINFEKIEIQLIATNRGNQNESADNIATIIGRSSRVAIARRVF